MNILVCFKIVKDYDDILQRDWQSVKKNDDKNLAKTDSFIDMSYGKWKINDFDEAALEQALSLKDIATDAIITALAIGSDTYQPILKNILSVGVDKLYHINDSLSYFSWTKIPVIIYEFIKKSEIKYDVIILGNSAGNQGFGTTPQILSELINYPLISHVLNAKIEGSDIIVSNELDNGIGERILSPPIVLSMGNADKSALRFATLREKIKSKEKEVKKLDIESTSLKEFVLSDIYFRRVSKETQILYKDNLEEILSLLSSEMDEKL